MKEIMQFAIYLLVGFVEMFLITQRTVFIAKNKRKAAALIVFFENAITFFVIIQLAKDVSNNLLAFIAYCVGSCSGTIVDTEKFLHLE